MRKPFLAAVALMLLSGSPSIAQVPRLLNYQGHLAAGDTSLAGTFRMTFSIYAVPTGGVPIWTETQSVAVTEGLFHVLLGSVAPLPSSLFSEADRYLGVRVESDAEMAPRQRIVSVGYAFRAETADDVKGRDVAPASVSISGAGPVIDRQGRWVGGNVTARAVTADSVVTPGGGLAIDRQGRWVGPPQPVRLNYVAVGPKGSADAPIAVNTNVWRDIEAFLAPMTLSAASVLDVRFDGMLVAGSNCQLRIRVDGNTSAGNLSGVDRTLTGGRRHTAVGLCAIVPVAAGEHVVALQGIIGKAEDEQFLSAQIQSGLLTVRIYAP
jgi:hypothetical protein